MKSFFVFAVCLLFVQVNAQDDGQKLVKTLIENSDEWISIANRLLHEYRNHSYSHLLEAVEEEVILAEALITDLKKQTNTDTSPLPELHHLHVIQEELLHHKNRISEELEIIEVIFNRPSTNKSISLDKLLHGTRKLLNNAKVELAQLTRQNADQKELVAIKREIDAVQKLNKHLETDPQATDLKNHDELLFRHRESLRKLFERAIRRQQLLTKSQ